MKSWIYLSSLIIITSAFAWMSPAWAGNHCNPSTGGNWGQVIGTTRVWLLSCTMNGSNCVSWTTNSSGDINGISQTFNITSYTPCSSGGVMSGAVRNYQSDPSYNFSKRIDNLPASGKNVIATLATRTGSVRTGVSIHLYEPGSWKGDIMVNLNSGWNSPNTQIMNNVSVPGLAGNWKVYSDFNPAGAKRIVFAPMSNIYYINCDFSQLLKRMKNMKKWFGNHYVTQAGMVIEAYTGNLPNSGTVQYTGLVIDGL